MMRHAAFILYSVIARQALAHIEGYLLSPIGVFKAVDVPYWNQVTSQGVGVEVKVVQEGSLASFEPLEAIPLLSPNQRTAIATAFPYLFHREELRQEASWVKAMRGRSSFLDEVIRARDMLSPNQEAYKRYPSSSLDAYSQQLPSLQKLYLSGAFTWTSAIGLNPANNPTASPTVYCKRCLFGKAQHASIWQWMKNWVLGQEQLIQVACQTCGSDACSYCPQCISLGIAKACSPYMLWENNPLHVKNQVPASISYGWKGELSALQQHASDQLLHTVQHHASGQRGHGEFLVWAVCGSGKTELLFETILYYLQGNLSVLITSPRRDVIMELYPRIQEAFPETAILVLHGESEEKFKDAAITLSTTHQAARFQDYFDLVIIDEEDAFPFHIDPMLQLAVQKAKKESGMTVYLTATPTVDMIRRVEQGILPYVLLYERYHQHPLAIPIIQTVGNWRKRMDKQYILTELLEYLTHLLQTDRAGYLFVPHVKDVERVQQYLQHILLPYITISHSDNKQGEHGNKDTGVREGLDMSTTTHPPFVIESVHAQDEQRKEKVQRFRDGHIRLLITTTILERGVTIPYCDVVVLGSDEPVFTASALIQMAGRVGRKREDPVGNVWFLPAVRTNAQLQCIRSIKKMNRMAIRMRGSR